MGGVHFTEQRLNDILRQIRGKRVAVLGDLMLDRYYWGTVRRVSPEAPVPVVEVEQESIRFGGAANVAKNIQALGGIPLLVGLIGNDHLGEVFLSMMTEQGFDAGGIVIDTTRQTTVKTRVIAQGQHVVRIDNETRESCDGDLVTRLVDAVRSGIQSIDAILIEDYNKGVLAPGVIHQVLSVAAKQRKVVTVDPKFDHFLDFKGVTLFKPNRREVEEILGGRLRTRTDVEQAGRRLLELLDAENILLTRGEEGMSLFERNGGAMHLHATAKNVQDVSGAGDSVIATLTLAMAAGVPVREATVLANCAGGVVVGSVGIVPIEPDQLLRAALEVSRQGEGDV